MLKAENLSKSFGNLEAVSELSLQVEKGEVVGLLGPNGAGKTTTMKMLAGLLNPDSGNVELEGSVRDKVAVVFQEVEYSSKLKVKEFLKLMSILNENNRQKEIMKEVGLESFSDAFVLDLSGGNKKKLNMASGLLKDPDYLLLDEPSSGLDPRARKSVRSMIKDFSKDRGVLVSTHSMEEAEKLCDRVVIIENGSEVVSGSPDELVSQIDAEFVIKARGELSPNIDYQMVQKEDFFEIRIDKPHVVIKELVDSGSIDDLEDLSIEKPGLEDVFFEVTGRRYEEDN